MDNFVRSVNNLQNALKTAKSKNIDLTKKTDGSSFTDYKALKNDYLRKAVETSLKAVKNYVFELHELSKIQRNTEYIIKIQDLVKNLSPDDISKVEKSVNAIKDLLEKIEIPRSEQKLSLKIKYIPKEIKADVLADIKELEKCFNAGCYRSTTIICGRILETALHRKYFETTGFDILEKNPGIGLGTLIAKLREKNVELDPGVTQQIHLVNQVRIFSVHTKKEAFYPSKAQTYAMILYTMDVLEKLF